MSSNPSTPEPRGTKRTRQEDIVDEVQFGSNSENVSPNYATLPSSVKNTPESQIAVPRVIPPGAPQRPTDAERARTHVEATIACIEALRDFLKVCCSGHAPSLNSDHFGSRATHLLRELDVCFPENTRT